MSGALVSPVVLVLALLALLALLWCARPRRSSTTQRAWPVAEAPIESQPNRANRRRGAAVSHRPLHRRPHNRGSTERWKPRGRKLKQGKLPRRVPRPRPAGVHFLRSPRTPPIQLPEGTHYAWCACGQLKTGTPDELDRWWVRHCSRFDFSTLEAGIAALRARSTRRQRWAHTTRELSVLAHAWLLLREPGRWHPALELRELAGTVRRAALLTVDVIPAAITAPAERTTTVPVLDETEHWTRERRTMHREWRVGRWGWWDPVRNKWYPSLALSGGATIVAAVGGGNWSAGGSWVGGSAPGSGDDAQLTATSGNITVDLTTNACRSLDCTGYTHTLTFGTGNTLAVGDGSGGAVKFVGTMAINDAIGTLKLVSTSNNGGTGWAVTTGGLTLPATTCNGVGGKWVLQDATTFGAQMTLTNGAFFGNGKTINGTVFSLSNSNTRTLDITNCAITLSATTAWSSTNSTGLTFTSTGSSITFTWTAPSNTMGTLSYGTVIYNGFTNLGTFTGAATFVNLTLTGAASKTSTFQLQSNITVTGTLTLNSNAAVNRLLVLSNTRGTQRTITATGATVVIDNTAAATGSSVDFMDVTITGTPTWSVLHSTLVGDCGGNGGAITSNATTPATQTHTSSAGGSWSDVTKWTSRVPLPQDNVVVDVNTTGTLTSDMPRLGANLTFTGFNGTWTNSAVNEMYGNLVLSTTTTTSGTNALTVAGRGSQTITSNTKTLQPLTISGPGGTYTLQDALTVNGTCTLNGGTFTTNDNSVSLFQMAFLNGTTNISTINMGASVFSVQQTVGGTTIWNEAGFVTVNAGTSTISIAVASSGTRTFVGGGKTYGTLSYTVAGSTGTLAITGSNTWAGNWNLSDATNARAVTIANGTTQTFTSTGSFFNVSGSSGKNTTFASTTPGSAYTLTKTSGAAVFVDFVTVTDSTATGGLWVDGTHYTNGGGNTGWTFADNILTGADTGTATDAAVSVAFTSTDTGSGADAAVSVAFTSTDVGAGADSGSIAAAATGADTGTGVDASVVTSDVQVTGADTGAGADDGSLAASLTGADTGSSSDAASLAATATGPETGTGADTGALSASLTATDAGSGDDEATATATLTGADTGAGADSGAVTATPTGTDTATGADAGVMAASATGADTAQGADAATLAVSLTGTEVGAGTETGIAGVDVSEDEIGVGVESGTVAATAGGADTATGVDVGALVAAAVSGSELGSGADADAITVTVPGAETGAGADAGAVNLDLFGSEVAVAVEFASLVANLTGAETGVGVDFGQGGVLIVGSDTGTGVDGSSVRLAVLLLEVGEIVSRWSAGPLQPSQWGTRGIVGRITAGP